MRRFLSNGLLAALAGALLVAESPAGVFRRPAPPANPPAPPAWLAPGPRVYRTQYPEFSSAATSPSALRATIDPRPLVWVLDGAGDYRGCSQALMHANLQFNNPIELAVFPWSHGHGKMVLDQTDLTHSRNQGARLAEKILARQKQEPGRRVIVVGHSAGCAVVLAACDVLPPGAVDRVILLAPSVSSGYDVRPTLRSAHEGMDVFCSKKDWIALGFVTRVVGTVDRRWAPAAGRHGFQIRAEDDPYGELRQHFWTPEMARVGNNGGHYGVYAPAFIHAYLFPAMGAKSP